MWLEGGVVGGFLYKLCGTVIAFGSRGNSFKCIRERGGGRKQRCVGGVGSGGFGKRGGGW